jgi:hypothetical protein
MHRRNYQQQKSVDLSRPYLFAGADTFFPIWDTANLHRDGVSKKSWSVLREQDVSWLIRQLCYTNSLATVVSPMGLSPKVPISGVHEERHRTVIGEAAPLPALGNFVSLIHLRLGSCCSVHDVKLWPDITPPLRCETGMIM